MSWDDLVELEDLIGKRKSILSPGSTTASAGSVTMMPHSEQDFFESFPAMSADRDLVPGNDSSDDEDAKVAASGVMAAMEAERCAFGGEDISQPVPAGQSSPHSTAPTQEIETPDADDTTPKLNLNGAASASDDQSAITELGLEDIKDQHGNSIDFEANRLVELHQVLKSAEDKANHFVDQDAELIKLLKDATEVAIKGNKHPLSNRFYRDHQKGSKNHDALKLCVTVGDKDDFKREWAGRLLAKIEIKKSHVKSYRKVDRKKGVKMDLGQLVESYGILYNRDRAIRLGTLAARRCVEMGGDWVSTCALTGTLLFTKLLPEWSEEFDEKWALFEVERDNSERDKEIPDEVPKPEEKTQRNNSADKKDKRTEKKHDMDDAPDKKDKKQKKEKEADTLNDACKDALKLKRKWQTVECDACSLESLINNDDKFKEFRGRQLKSLTDSKMELEKEKIGFNQLFLASEVKDMKESFNPNELQMKLIQFMASADKVNKLEACRNKLKKRTLIT